MRYDDLGLGREVVERQAKKPQYGEVCQRAEAGNKVEARLDHRANPSLPRSDRGSIGAHHTEPDGAFAESSPRGANGKRVVDEMKEHREQEPLVVLHGEEARKSDREVAFPGDPNQDSLRSTMKSVTM
mgnify:CR=1 FL=1